MEKYSTKNSAREFRPETGRVEHSPGKFHKQYRNKAHSHKSHGLKCYGFLDNNGKFDCAKFGYGDMAFIPGTTIAGEKRRGEFVNCKLEADWICISTFEHSRKGRVESNIRFILCCELDLDGNPEIHISEDVIRQRCYMLALPLPLIMETSPGRHQLKFYFRVPIGADKLRLWKVVQQALYLAFQDLGADPKALDPVRFLRNEHQVNAVNKKYPHKPRVIVREKGVKFSLSQLYHILKRHGFIKQTDRIPLETSRRRLMAFLRLRGSITATYAELSKLTSIPLRTLKLLVSEKVREGYLTTKVQGKGNNRKTLFILKVHIRSFNNYSALMRKFLSVGACVGTRDLTVFACSLEIKIKKNNSASVGEVAALLEPGFLLCESGTHSFSRRDFLKCIRSALLNDTYKYMYSHKKLIELGLLNSECEKVDSHTSAITTGVKLDSTESISKLVTSVEQVFDGVRVYREPREDKDQLQQYLKVMNLRMFGEALYPDNEKTHSRHSSTSDQGPYEEPWRNEIWRRNIERDPDFYK